MQPTNLEVPLVKFIVGNVVAHPRTTDLECLKLEREGSNWQPVTVQMSAREKIDDGKCN